MASLITKKKRGREYLYWVRSARVNGKPRIVEQVYLGPKDRVLQEIKDSYSSSNSPAPSPLREVHNREFGASALLWRWAEELKLAEIVDRHVPQPPSRRRTHLSVGQYLLLATINRAVQASSKRALYEDWYRHSVVSRLLKAEKNDLTSQRFWDHMDQVETQHIEAIQQDLMERLSQLFPLGEQTVLYDTTNYFTFIDTFNNRAELPQRGKNKQGRANLRQVSLALFEDEKTGVPLYHCCYEGNQNDVSQFGDAWSEMLKAWTRVLDRPPEQLTLVFDAGNTSKANLSNLEDQSIHYVAAIPLGWLPSLLDVDLKHFTKLNLPNSKHVKSYRSTEKLWGRERIVLVTFSPKLFCTQRATMNRQQQKAEEQLLQLAGLIDAWRQSRMGKGHRKSSVEKKIRSWCVREHLSEFLDVELETEDDKVSRLTWTWNSERKRNIQRRWLGKRLLVTDKREWSELDIVAAYRKLSRTERHFRLSKGRRGPWWPMHHWTDSKIRVHALYCHFALVLLGIVQDQLQRGGLSMSVDRAVHHLARIDESVVVYSNGAANRVLSHLSETQKAIASAVHLESIAQEMGTTPL